MERKPKTRRRTRNSMNVLRRPSFFKVILKDHTQELRIPPAFVKQFNSEIRNEFILRSSTRKVWHVKVKTVNNALFFQNGWADFAKENLIQMGDFLVFVYLGNSKFDVKVFGKTGCLKEEAPMGEDECSSYQEKEQGKERNFAKNTNTCRRNNSEVRNQMQSGQPGKTKYACPFESTDPNYTALRGERQLNYEDLPHYRYRQMWSRIYSWWDVMDLTVRDLINQSPFGHFMKIPPLRTSGNFLRAIVERWKGETNTFHLPFGEATITPMDFFMLTGLPMDGSPVTFNKIPDDNRIRELIGDLPRRRCNTLYIRWIIKNFQSGIIKTDKERLQHARAFILALLGGVILCNGSDCVHVGYLELLVEFPQNKYDWGGAAYAHLLHSLRRVNRPSTKNVSVGGLAVTLKCWFYEHFPDQFPLLETAAPAFPCMTKWAPLARAQTLPPNCFNAIGSQLDSMKRQQFLADPYCQSVFATVPEAVHASFLCAHRVIFRCANEFEWYLGERVRTQFGKDLSVPCDPEIKYPVRLGDEEYIQLRAHLRPESEFLNQRLNNYKEWYAQASRPQTPLHKSWTRQPKGQPGLHHVSNVHKSPPSTSQLSHDELIEKLAACQQILEHHGLNCERELAKEMGRAQTRDNEDEDKDEDDNDEDNEDEDDDDGDGDDDEDEDEEDDDDEYEYEDEEEDEDE
ncbi:hypothetical protein AAC387_Pa05g1681 [Persea americana]